MNRKEARQILERFRKAANLIIQQNRFKKLVSNPFGVNTNTENKKTIGFDFRTNGNQTEGKYTTEYLNIFSKYNISVDDQKSKNISKI